MGFRKGLDERRPSRNVKSRSSEELSDCEHLVPRKRLCRQLAVVPSAYGTHGDGRGEPSLPERISA